MKNSTKKVLLGAATVAAALSTGNVAKAATANINMQAIIAAPVAITAVNSLNFGILDPGVGGGTATVDNTNTLAVGGTVTGQGGTVQSGDFTLTAGIGLQVNVTGPTKATLTHTTAGVNTMSVTTFKIDNAAGTINATAFTHVMVAATDTGFKLGGTLNVAIAQVVGTYTGTVLLTAVYN